MDDLKIPLLPNKDKKYICLLLDCPWEFIPIIGTRPSTGLKDRLLAREPLAKDLIRAVGVQEQRNIGLILTMIYKAFLKPVKRNFTSSSYEQGFHSVKSALVKRILG